MSLKKPQQKLDAIRNKLFDDAYTAFGHLVNPTLKEMLIGLDDDSECEPLHKDLTTDTQ